MLIKIQPQVTINVGSAGSTASSEITYTAYDTAPLNPTLGDFRMIPNRVLNSPAATVEWYDDSKNKWTAGSVTMYDRALAHELKANFPDTADYVHYRLNITDTSAGKVVDGDVRKPSFAINNGQGE